VVARPPSLARLRVYAVTVKARRHFEVRTDIYSGCDCMTYISDSVFAAHSTQWMRLLRRDTIAHAIYSLGVTFNLWRSPAFDDSARKDGALSHDNLIMRFWRG
jgi:hypothetical protein